MDFFTINQANGILSINTDALHGDLLGVASFTNGDLPLPPPKKILALQQVQTVDFTNGDIPYPPPKKLTITQTIDIWNGDVQLPPPKQLTVLSSSYLVSDGAIALPHTVDIMNEGIPLPPPKK